MHRLVRPVRPVRLFGLLGLLALAACGDDPALTGLEGVYTVATWTSNQTSCDAEGGSVAAVHEPMLFLKAESFFGSEFVNIVTCPDQAECTTQAQDDDTLHLGGYSFEDGSDKAGWTSHSAFGFGSGGTCNGVVTDTRLTATGQTIRVERRSTDAAPFTGAECTDEAAEAAAAGQPCTELEVMTATFTADF